MFVGVPRLFWFQRFHYCFEGFQGCFQMPCKAPNNPMVFLRAARAFLTSHYASEPTWLLLYRIQFDLVRLPKGVFLVCFRVLKSF